MSERSHFMLPKPFDDHHGTSGVGGGGGDLGTEVVALWNNSVNLVKSNLKSTAVILGVGVAAAYIYTRYYAPYVEATAPAEEESSITSKSATHHGVGLFDSTSSLDNIPSKQSWETVQLVIPLPAPRPPTGSAAGKPVPAYVPAPTAAATVPVIIPSTSSTHTATTTTAGRTDSQLSTLSIYSTSSETTGGVDPRSDQLTARVAQLVRAALADDGQSDQDNSSSSRHGPVYPHQHVLPSGGSGGVVGGPRPRQLPGPESSEAASTSSSSSSGSNRERIRAIARKIKKAEPLSVDEAEYFFSSFKAYKNHQSGKGRPSVQLQKDKSKVYITAYSHSQTVEPPPASGPVVQLPSQLKSGEDGGKFGGPAPPAPASGLDLELESKEANPQDLTLAKIHHAEGKTPPPPPLVALPALLALPEPKLEEDGYGKSYTSSVSSIISHTSSAGSRHSRTSSVGSRHSRFLSSPSQTTFTLWWEREFGFTFPFPMPDGEHLKLLSPVSRADVSTL